MRAMGRKPTKYLNLPPRMRARDRRGVVWYYYDAGGKPRKEIPLGKDYTVAVGKWAELEGNQTNTSQLLFFKDAADRYLRDVLPTKAERTRRDNLIELDWLLKFFNNPPAPLAEIQPINIRQYMDWRVDQSKKRLLDDNAERIKAGKSPLEFTGREGKVRANREKALFSHIWNKAREWGLTDRPNPCAGIKGYSETGRDIYIEDEVFEAVWQAGCQSMRDAMDLAYLTGQRPDDVISASELDIKKGALEFNQGKTGKKLRIEIVGELDTLIKRIKARKESYKVHTLALICTETGRPLTQSNYRDRFDKAREAAAKANPKLADDIRKFQFKDLRAKAGTDKAESSGDIRQAQKQLGHTTIAMTEHYTRDRRGDLVKPTK
ncbi:tyrosine recombinase XerC [mine drainage metagenome]|uniref:Tyrosine recombinase XerC n=1 Tax=mine drainage metagenome TaxID=410659 RepID=A0A1J5TB49_9ZZZZ